MEQMAHSASPIETLVIPRCDSNDISIFHSSLGTKRNYPALLTAVALLELVRGSHLRKLNHLYEIYIRVAEPSRVLRGTEVNEISH